MRFEFQFSYWYEAFICPFVIKYKLRTYGEVLSVTYEAWRDFFRGSHGRKYRTEKNHPTDRAISSHR